MLPKLLLRLFPLLLVCLCSVNLSWAESRSALVIGNSTYSFGPLLNPENDAKLLAQTLEKTGFTVKTVLNADRQTMQKALLDFSRDIRDKDTVGLFYFAGHGAQVAGQNYLIPVDADIKAESEVKIFGINVDEFVATLERADGRTNIVILDSCRNNPFGAAARSARKGLAAIDAPAGTFIAYSTAPGQVALDGDGLNSPYATALSKAMIAPNVSIEQAFKLTRRDVLNATDKVQVPWESSSLTGDFVFTPSAEIAPVVAAPAPEPAPEPQVAVADPPPSEAAQATTSVREMTIEPQIFPVGKWPEGIAIADNAIWVAESGSRRIVKIDPGSGDLLEAVPVGRLPVPMVNDPAGNIYTATYTDQQIFKQPPGGGKGKSIASFKGKSILEGLAFGDGAIFAATRTLDGVANIVRIDPKTGKSKFSEPFPATSSGLLNGLVTVDDQLWMLKGGAGTIVEVFNAKTLKSNSQTALEGFVWSFGANLDAVFAAGREQQQGGKSIIHRMARGNPDDKHIQVLDGEELIMAVAANNDRVAALGDQGGVWILDASSLQPLKHFNTGKRPQAAVFENGNLFITSHQGEGDNGVVMIYTGVGNLD